MLQIAHLGNDTGPAGDLIDDYAIFEDGKPVAVLNTTTDEYKTSFMLVKNDPMWSPAGFANDAHIIASINMLLLRDFTAEHDSLYESFYTEDENGDLCKYRKELLPISLS